MLASSPPLVAPSITESQHLQHPSGGLRLGSCHSDTRHGAVTPNPLPGSACTSIRSGFDSHIVNRSHPLLLTPDTPRSSILINPKRNSYKGLIVEPPILDLFPNGLRPAPVVKRIPAVVSAKASEREREKERERERERQRERDKDKLKSKSDERIWGIPKKALLLGLGDLNFNAQVAMLGGWGHGSGSASNLVSPDDAAAAQQANKAGAQSQVADSGKRPAAGSDGPAVDDDEPAEKLDPEELAALNAIINTRRSMAAAQALVNGQVSFNPRPARAGSQGSTTSASTRPTLADLRAGSQDSVPSMSSIGQTSSSVESTHETLPCVAVGHASGTPSSPGERLGDIAAVGFSASLLGSSPSRQAKIRFAPLPQAFGPLSSKADMDGEAPDRPDATVHVGDTARVHDHANRLKRTDSNLSEDVDSDSDYDSDDSSTGKGKWYLMGMPSSVFKPEHYQKARRRGRHSKTPSVSGFSSGEETVDSKEARVSRRKSTGSVSELLSQELVRIGWSREPSNAPSDKDDDERGRKPGRSRSKSRASSSSRKSNRSSSRNGARGSGDEDERARRRELIRLARPGGTGMVTLADGTKIRARRVNDPVQDLGEPEFNEWGFAGLAKEASRRGNGTRASGDLTDPYLDEEDDGAPPTKPLAGSPRPEVPADAADATPIDVNAVAFDVQATDSVADNASVTFEVPSLVQDRAPATTPETGSLSGSGLLKKIESRASDKAAPLTPGLALSADQAEEIRRRHENEVYALGAEVLAQNRRNAQRRASAKGAANSTHSNAHAHPTKPGKSTNAASSSQPGSKLASKPNSRDGSREGRRIDELQPLSTISKAFLPSLRKATGDSERTISPGKAQVATDDVSPAKRASGTRPQALLVDDGVHVQSPTSSIVDIRNASPLIEINDAAPMKRIDSEEALSRRSSTIDQATSPIGSTQSPYNLLQGSASQASNLSVQTMSRVGPAHSPKSRRIHLDPSVSVPAPSPWLPRRPDAKGMAVVPLPQLGIRPERPHEGRVWQYDDVDDSSDESDGDRGTRPPVMRINSHVDSDDDDLNAEELEEEERKTAMQKKRATTRAAGQEVVYSRSMAVDARSQPPDVKAHRSSGADTEGRAATARSRSVKAINSATSLRQHPDKKARATTASTSHKAPRASRSLSNVHASTSMADILGDDEEEKNLWPAAAASASSKFGTPKPRHILVNLPGGPGIWDSKKGGGANAVAAINSVAAARAKAIKERAQRHKSAGTRESFELPENWDDEMMDYGWPRSLKGSLY
ncbi:uncharacterized protein PSFLO_06946 [Pseudozyma flocculosa]|uniref:Uncharacterized protein n=1 Tax=Pseudozyma flocculosa TaxID=84751 RepID=A0A5C3FAJ2_9BASI|nr:uncharacterized protein PSFLO_06946 [Pseudozyma flocculosa]